MCKYANMKIWKYGNVKVLATLAVSIFAYFHISTIAYSAEVTSAEAQEAVQGWATLGDALEGRFDAAIGGVETFAGLGGTGTFHVVSFEGGGFAVTSGDTELTPILAYSESGAFVAGDENPLWVMLTQDVAGRTMQSGESVRKRGMSANASAWARLRNATKPLLKATTAGYDKSDSVADLRVAPLCKTLWAQGNAKGGHCYNYYTPSNYWSGCVATAMAQIMKRFEWPKTKVEIGNHWYTRTVEPTDADPITWRVGVDPDTGVEYGLDPIFTGPAFGGPYDWANMTDVPETAASFSDVQRRAIGQLCRDCGISVNMRYTPSGSSAYLGDVREGLVNQFGYANAECFNKAGTAEERRNAMLASFDLGSPCALSIRHLNGGDVVNHAIVGDGYGYSDGQLYIHLNFGYGATATTAWYTPAEDGNSKLVSIKGIVYNIWTPEMCAETNRTIVSGRIIGPNGKPAKVMGIGVTAKNAATGESFGATSNENGIYALLLPPEATYEIVAEANGRSARTTRSVARCVTSASSSSSVVANQPGVDLTLAAPSSGAADVWIDESAVASEWTGEWSSGIAYEADGRAELFGEVVFTPCNASTGNVVTVETKALFCEYDGNDEPDATAQAAVRLGTNGCFQVWCDNAWHDAEAEGVTPVSGEEYTLLTTFDYKSGTYSVNVNNSALKLNTPTPTTSFPLAIDTNCVTSIAFVGNTYFTSLLGGCRLVVTGFQPGEITVADATVILDAAKAEWLNARGDHADVSDRLANVASNEFATAWLCNLDLMNEDASAELKITGVAVNADNVEISVTLVRKGKVAQKINGALKFYGAATLEEFKTAASPIGTVTLSDEGGDFSDGDTTTATFEKNGNTFFNAKIEEN